MMRLATQQTDKYEHVDALNGTRSPDTLLDDMFTSIHDQRNTRTIILNGSIKTILANALQTG